MQLVDPVPVGLVADQDVTEGLSSGRREILTEFVVVTIASYGTILRGPNGLRANRRRHTG
jgi:hypothetical protein